MTITATTPTWLKQAIRFTRNAGRKNRTAKRIRAIIAAVEAGTLTPEEGRRLFGAETLDPDGAAQ